MLFWCATGFNGVPAPPARQGRRRRPQPPSLTRCDTRGTRTRGAMAKVKAHELKRKSKQELLTQLNELKTELAALRVAKVTGGAPNKLSKIKVVRKSIARVHTVYRANIRTALRNKISADKDNKKGKTYLPLDLRTKKTRAIRRALSKEQKEKRTKKELKRVNAFPLRKFAVKA